jgi:putative membrane protein
MLRWVLAALHLLALGIGLGAVWARARALRSALEVPENLRRVFLADALWGAAGFLWISTGLWRLLGGLEKGTSYYLQNHVFLTKMGLLILLLILEVVPVVTLIRWRKAAAAGSPGDFRAAGRLATLSQIQVWLVVLMVFAATAMARGLGTSGSDAPASP